LKREVVRRTFPNNYYDYVDIEKLKKDAGKLNYGWKFSDKRITRAYFLQKRDYA